MEFLGDALRVPKRMRTLSIMGNFTCVQMPRILFLIFIISFYFSYLLQIFALPLFDEETFFLEVFQLLGARGFGAGNVTALAKSIDEERLYQLQQGQILISQSSLTELKCQTDS